MNSSETLPVFGTRQTRIVLAAVRVLVFAGLAVLGLGSPPRHRVLYWAITLIYGVTIFGYLWAKNRDYEFRRVRYVVFLFDISVVSMLIVLRGESVPSFIAAYFTLVLMAAVAEGLGNALVNAVLVSIGYAVLTHWGDDPASFLSFASVSQFAFFFVVAIFMAEMASLARQEARGKILAERELQHTSVELRQSTEELKAAREVLRANDRLATLGMLSAGIAHELKNPLAAILGNLEPVGEIVDDLLCAVRAGRDGEEEVREVREIVRDCRLACDQLKRVAGDLSSISRRGKAQAEPLDPRHAIDTALRILRTRIPSGMQVDARALTGRTIMADPGRVLQILLNLGGNALDAMGDQPGGRLALRAEDAGPFRVVFLVEDNGPGIPEDVRARIFEPFFTTKRPGQGTGLGLHLVSEIVRSLRGTIHCETREGAGTRFRVELPVYIQRIPSEVSHHVPDEVQGPDRGRRGHDPQGAEAHVPSRAV